eukprot:TRINITY_DN7234_c1_g1_i5.p1 TRINITY_DN7234_c1_g1~~TRINITY_DN7234_c1_g1_i5.p1  ORF type:complete len:235 (-),score=37.59 TRINITY_DN7234_c1_g1_i5:312-1016(-)
MASDCSTLPPMAVKAEVSQDAAAANAGQSAGPHAPCGPAWQEGFVCNIADTSGSFQAEVPDSCLSAQALSAQNEGGATRDAQLHPFHGQGERWLCTQGSLNVLSKSDSCMSMSSLSECGTDISHAATDCSSPDSMPAWLRERVVRRGDANPAMEFQREERPGQRALIVVRSLDGEVVAQIEEQEFDDNLSETSDCTEVDIESSASGLAMAQFLSEMIRQREASRTEAEGNDRVA